MAKSLPMARPLNRPRPATNPLQPRVTLLGPPISQGRPSVNLGHVFNSSINPLPHLHSGLGNTNPIPFNILNPRNNVPTPSRPVNSLGNRISTAIAAVVRPSAARQGGITPTVPYSVRIRQAINNVRTG